MTDPMPSTRRELVYKLQTGRSELTPTQRRRARHKLLRALATAERTMAQRRAKLGGKLRPQPATAEQRSRGTWAQG
jgi:hypothetical protein